MNSIPARMPRVVIVGGGFGGLAAARALRRASVEVILIDRTNHHLFQPLLYQVATSALTPGQIGWPIRNILRRQSNTTVILGEVTGVNKERTRRSGTSWQALRTAVRCRSRTTT